jgi:hypothetical protein
MSDFVSSESTSSGSLLTAFGATSTGDGGFPPHDRSSWILSSSFGDHPMSKSLSKILSDKVAASCTLEDVAFSVKTSSRRPIASRWSFAAATISPRLRRR